MNLVITFIGAGLLLSGCQRSPDIKANLSSSLRSVAVVKRQHAFGRLDVSREEVSYNPAQIRTQTRESRLF
jgi:hypothetical protein